MTFSTAQRVSLSDGRMTIAGVAGGFVQAPARRLRLKASGLEPRRGHVLRDGALTDDGRIEARVRLTEDRLGLAGRDGEAGEMALTIRPIPEAGAAPRILLVLGFGGERPEFHATLWLPGGIFAALSRDAQAGRAAELDLVATTGLWLGEAERDAPAGRPVTWRLLPGEDGGDEARARGLVERIDWGAASLREPAAAASAEDDHAETAAEAIGRLTWSLRQIALVLVFLLIVVAVK